MVRFCSRSSLLRSFSSYPRFIVIVESGKRVTNLSWFHYFNIRAPDVWEDVEYLSHIDYSVHVYWIRKMNMCLKNFLKPSVWAFSGLIFSFCNCKKKLLNAFLTPLSGRVPHCPLIPNPYPTLSKCFGWTFKYGSPKSLITLQAPFDLLFAKQCPIYGSLRLVSLTSDKRCLLLCLELLN